MDLIKKINLYLFNSSVAFIVATLNLYIFFTEKEGLIYLFTNVIFFYVGSIITIFMYKKKIYKWNAFAYYLTGIIIILFDPRPNLTGAMFIGFAIIIYSTQKTNILILIITLLLLTLKAVIYDFDIPSIVGLFAGYSFSLIIFHILFNPQKITCKIPKTDETTEEIIQYLITGLSPKEISEKINITPDAVRKRIQRVCKLNECRNTEQLVYKLMEKRYFCLK